MSAFGSGAGRLPPAHDPAQLADFLDSTPPVVTRLLVELAPALSVLRKLAQVLSWNSGKTGESWLVLFGFVGACLTIPPAVRYLFPVIALTPYIISSVWFRLFRPRPKASWAPSTEATLTRSLSDVAALQALTPTLPAFIRHGSPLTVFATIRLLVFTYIVYVVAVFALPLHQIVAALGTIALTWRAPWVRTTRRIIFGAGWIRFISRKLWTAITGLKARAAPAPPLPVEAESAKVAFVAAAKDSKGPAESTKTSTVIPEDQPAPLRFRFTTYENQRWWMGLDWTAALLPTERASWTSSAGSGLQPILPPMLISLPGPKTATVPLSGKDEKKGSTKGKKMIQKRTATWSWEDAEWAVLVKLTSNKPAERVVTALPELDDSELAAKSNEHRLQRGLNKIGGELGYRPASTAALTGGEEDGVEHGGRSVPLVGENDDENQRTDADGWIYGDNKWQNPVGRGGMGKYTRSRRWVRVALLTEKVEVVQEG